MSQENMTENEVFKTLRDCINAGLAFLGYNQGVEVQRFAQANMNYIDNAVLLHMIEHRRMGWQARYYDYDSLSNKLSRRDEWIDQQTWLVECLKRMRNEDTTSTISADDMSQGLVTWFNGRGLDWLRKKGIATLPIDPSEIIVYNDDSQLYQRRPVFSLVVQIPKLLRGNVDNLSALEVKTYPI